jgi:hydrogenase nickel incorporation protein HypA/HybF
MHDSSTFDALLRRIAALAAQHDARRVTEVRVQLGRLAHMSPEHFRQHFEESSRGTLAEGAAVRAEPCDELFDVFLVDVELEA